MKPGRELDALIAEKVMQIDPITWLQGFEIPPYSTDIAAAWLVVEKLRVRQKPKPRGIRWVIESTVDYDTDESRWGASFEDGYPEEINLIKADTAPHAICLAALKAVGWKGEE